MMTKTIDALTKVLESTIEQLLLAGKEPRALVRDVVSHCFWSSGKMLAELAIEQMKVNDSCRAESNRWLNEGLAWDRAIRESEADWGAYLRESRGHDRLINDIHATDDMIYRQAKYFSSAAYQATLLERHFKLLSTVPSSQNSEIVEDIFKEMFEQAQVMRETSNDDYFDEQRFERVLRALVGYGRFDQATIFGGGLESQPTRPPTSYDGREFEDDVPF